MPRRERSNADDLITMLCWIDEYGNPVEEVSDRFQSRYIFRNEQTGEVYTSSYTLAHSGLSTLTLRDLITFGFSTAEYKDIMQYESELNRYIQSEDELNELYPFESDDYPTSP